MTLQSHFVGNGDKAMKYFFKSLLMRISHFIIPEWIEE